MKKKKKRYNTCGNCPAQIREECPFYEPNTDDNLCVYDFLKPQKEKEKGDK